VSSNASRRRGTKSHSGGLGHGRAKPTGWWLVSADEANPLYDPAEYDVVVASGEQVTRACWRSLCKAMGCKARSWLGWQLPDPHRRAPMPRRASARSRPARCSPRWRAGEIAVIPGFQGLTDDNRVTTLGRGGSDTSAVAVAAAVKADRCDIYTDVDGVYTTDPRIVARARKLDKP
jgi:aspartate kinase